MHQYNSNYHLAIKMALKEVWVNDEKETLKFYNSPNSKCAKPLENDYEVSI